MLSLIRQTIHMNDETEMISQIRSIFPKLYVTEKTEDDMKFEPEQDDGYVEYKRTLADCSEGKAIKYATQMRWRITENFKKQCATYFIGIDDDGSVVGLTDDEIISCVKRFVSIAKSIGASIIGIHVIHIKEQTILKIGVKIKKIKDNYTFEFGDKF